MTVLFKHYISLSIWQRPMPTVTCDWETAGATSHAVTSMQVTMPHVS